MAALFKNNFFSIAGQKERLTNVVNVLKQSLNPFSKEKPVANVNNKVLKAGLEFVAANPYTSAALVAAPIAAGSRSFIAATASKAPLTAKIAAAAVAPAVLVSPKIQKAVVTTASKLTPESILKASVQTGKTIETPTASNIKDLFTENKTLLSAAAIATTLVVGSKAIPAAASLLQSKAISSQAKAIEEQTKFLSNIPKETIPTTSIDVVPKTPIYSADSNINQAGPSVIAKTETIGGVTKAKRKKAKKRIISAINIKNNVLVNNKISSIGVRATNKYINKKHCLITQCH